MGVSVITTIISVTMLAATTVGLGLEAWIANVLATAVATVPSYHLNRRWTWGKRDASDMWREVMPFWARLIGGGCHRPAERVDLLDEVALADATDRRVA